MCILLKSSRFICLGNSLRVTQLRLASAPLGSSVRGVIGRSILGLNVVELVYMLSS